MRRRPRSPYSNSACRACTNKPNGTFYTDAGDPAANNCDYDYCRRGGGRGGRGGGRRGGAGGGG